jgi:hypothetical protein
MTQYVAIGTDGMRPVVWGLGDSPEAALIEAREQVMLQSEDDCDFGGDVDASGDG